MEAVTNEQQIHHDVHHTLTSFANGFKNLAAEFENDLLHIAKTNGAAVVQETGGLVKEAAHQAINDLTAQVSDPHAAVDMAVDKGVAALISIIAGAL